MKKALILDLDNTIYPVSSIAENLFKQLFDLLEASADKIDYEVIKAAKDEFTRRPYQQVADKYNFSPELKNKGLELLKNITYDSPMQAFDGYAVIRTQPHKKFLVTTGFSKLQWSKIKMLDIEGDFEEIHIVDPELSTQTKKDVFTGIMERYNYVAADLLIIGDDPESEIKAATELGIETFLFDPDNKHLDVMVTFKAKHLEDALSHI